MTQKEKQLLLKDLCARLPYGVKVQHIVYGFVGIVRSIYYNLEGIEFESDDKHYDIPIEEIVPYLRLMSSMVEEEEAELDKTLQYTQFTLESYDWLNEHHFDYRGLIDKGLALEAPEGMYKTE